MSEGPPGTRQTFVAGDDAGRAAALVDALEHDGRHAARAITLDDAAGLLGSNGWELIVVLLSLADRSAEAADHLARKVDAAGSAQLVTSDTARRLVFVHMLDKRDSDDPGLFWLRDYVRGRCLFAVEAGVDHGVGVTLLRCVVDDLTDELWVRDVANTLIFLDSLAPSVMVPELELVRR